MLLLTQLLPFQINLDPTMIAGNSLWSLALYLGFSPISEWVICELSHLFAIMRKSLHTNKKDFEETCKEKESQGAFCASLLSIIPFLFVGILLSWGIEISLSRSWAISTGLLACITSGIYELGRRDGLSSK